MVAVNLARLSPVPLRIALIDGAGDFARGPAFATTRDEHILNVPAAAMGAFPDEPGDFVRWLRETGVPLADESAYLPRYLYAGYLQSLLESAERSEHRIVRMPLEIAEVREESEYAVLLTRDKEIACVATVAVLALGSLPPNQPAGFDVDAIRESPRYFADASAFLRAPQFDPDGGDTLVIGTGLTGLDVILSFRDAAPPGRLIALSRHGRFPLPHAPPGLAARDPFGATALPGTARGAFSQVRAAANAALRERADWRTIIDGVRPRTTELWEGFSPVERRRFLRHVRPLWEAHRHRAPQSSLDAKDALIASGKLVFRAGRLVDAKPIEGGLEVRYVARGTTNIETIRVASVVNCTGRTTDYELDGVARDPLGMGLRARADGRLVDATGNVHERLRAIGWPLRGALYESTAVRELRAQAKALAAELIAARSFQK
jgi:uncharacterized NAD(P)/FAD-binding protein YdhS